MVLTPWGDAEELRARRLRPGRRIAPEEVSRNQRERLFAAMVASCAERGYWETSVADLLRISGVSRSTFYEQFSGKEDCFRATIESLLEDSLRMIRNRYEIDLPWEERARNALEAFLWLASAQPAAARICLVESYAAGAAGLEPLQRAVRELAGLARLALEQMPAREQMPDDLAGAIGGGIHRVLYRRLHRHREAELPALGEELWAWAMSYPTPPRPLRLRRRRSPSGNGALPPVVPHDPEQRILRAFTAVVAAKGYAATKIADIAAAASISQSTFYVHFEDKREALTAALDYSGAQLAAATLPATRRARTWPEAVRVGYGTMCAFLAAEPDFARLRSLEVYAVGPEAIEQRDAAGAEILRSILSPVSAEEAPQASSVVTEATLGAIYAAIHNRVRATGPEGLPEIAPLLTYVTLAPLIGPEQACEVANGDGRRR
jgi:AcrR family transcriptional regulator